MKIIKLKAENYKVLKAITITPKGNTVVISGKNGQGKTSTLDTIWAALSGGEAGKKNKKPIREGEDYAIITLDLGDLIITRKWTSNEKSYLTVENKEGASFKSPQSILDSLVGRLTFDPLEFANLKNKEQLNALLETIDLGIDLDIVAARRVSIFSERTNINREVKRLEGVLSGMIKPDTGKLSVEVSASAILKEIKAAQGVERERTGLETRLETGAGVRAAAQEDMKVYRRKITEKEDLIKATDKGIDKLQKMLDVLVVPDIETLQAKLETVEKINAETRDANEYIQTEKSLDCQAGEAAELTKQIERLDKEKTDAIKAAKMPVDGLSFDEDGLTFKGVPFAQASSAEQLKVSIAMAMAINPKLRVIRITGGSLLDSDSMKIVEQMAVDNDFQIWVEVVDDTGKVGIYIEDGEITKD